MFILLVGHLGATHFSRRATDREDDFLIYGKTLLLCVRTHIRRDICLRAPASSLVRKQLFSVFEDDGIVCVWRGDHLHIASKTLIKIFRGSCATAARHAIGWLINRRRD